MGFVGGRNLDLKNGFWYLLPPQLPLEAYRDVAASTYNKQIVLCLSVPKDLANCLTDMVLLYRVDSQITGPGKVYNYFEGVYHHPP